MTPLLTITAALTTEPQPIIVLLLVGFGIGVLGHLAGSRALVAVGIVLVFVAGMLAPQF